jgi:hypothetical protein
MNFNTTETRLFQQFPELRDGLQVQEIERLERAIGTADLNRLKKAIQLGELMQQTCNWYDLPDTQTKFAEFGISWSREDIAQKVYLCSKSQMFKNIKAFEFNTANPNNLTEFNNQVKRLRRAGEKVNKSLEKFNAFSKQMLTAETPEIAAQVLIPNVEEITPETIAQDTEPPGETNVPEYELELTLKNRAVQFDLKVTADMQFQVEFNENLPFEPNYRAIVVSNIQDVWNLLNENRDNININIPNNE